MAIPDVQIDHGAAGGHHAGPLHHQYEDIDQQNESYIVGMWTFLITEVMFFGAMFLSYTVFRTHYQNDFYLSHRDLSAFWGGFNTGDLLTSSLIMALAVHYAQLKKPKQVIISLIVTFIGAVIFLVVHGSEYYADWVAHHFPGGAFMPPNGATENGSRLFYSIYFIMTGIHSIHVIIGGVAISILTLLWIKRNPIVTEDFVPTEMVGLYWHFVDLVWIFLFPLFYLIPK